MELTICCTIVSQPEVKARDLLDVFYTMALAKAMFSIACVMSESLDISTHGNPELT